MAYNSHMSNPAKARLVAALRHLLRPLARLMLRHGMSHGEFNAIAKSVYVEAAREDFALPGEKTTDSRVAILTGLTRKEVKVLQRAANGEHPEPSGNANRATRVLSGWYQDPDFAGRDGQPAALPLDGRGASFAALVRRYSGDIPPRALLDELKRMGAIAFDDLGRVHALSRSYVPQVGDVEGLRILGAALHDLTATIDYNLRREPNAPARYQRTLTAERMPRKAIPVLRRLVAERAQRFLESLDDWLSAHEVVDGGGADADHARTSVGIYFFQDKDDSAP